MNSSEQKKRSAAVTGAGAGLGRDIALGLAAKGYQVFGTAMSADEVMSSFRWVTRGSPISES